LLRLQWVSHHVSTRRLLSFHSRTLPLRYRAENHLWSKTA
jgi:hypothetical protein